MSQKCGKVKNPCKICLESVNNNTGLQCKGACKKWVHFVCLNYTPGKIQDIRAGGITITCPCPDCKTTQPKEYQTEHKFDCTNTNCPSHMPRSCTHSGCPKNQKMSQTSDHRPPPSWLCEKSACQKNVASRPNSAGSDQNPPSPDPDSPAQSPFSSETKLSGKASATMGMGIALKQMCNTVGQLANQINHLMNEMRTATQGADGKGRGNGQSNPRSGCPKPCHCPNNPRNKF